MLLEPADLSLAESSDEVLPRLSSGVARHCSAETHAAVVELATDVHRSPGDVAGELSSLRARLERELAATGLSAAAAGTYPLVTRSQTRVSGAPRYRRLAASLRALVRREPTMALHVHVGVADPEDAVRVLNRLVDAVPVLLALSANSPFAQGRDSGFASLRTVVFQAFPRTGLPRRFADYADYAQAVGPLIASRAIPDPTFLWWDVRLQPALGTVEVRVMDAQSSVAHSAPLIALVQSLSSAAIVEEARAPAAPPEVLAENRFLAARDGMGARLIDSARRTLTPVADLVDEVVAVCRPHAASLGCAAELEMVGALAAANGADRQRSSAAEAGDLAGLVAGLARGFAVSGAAVPA